MKNILIPYDFSNTAINALSYTKNLFEGLEINIYLLDVYLSKRPYMVSEEKSSEWFNEMDNEIEEELKYLVAVLNEEGNKNLSFHYIVDSNTLIGAIKKGSKKEENIDLIISGTKGVKSLAETFIGTNTMKIINTIDNTPILVVPTTYKYTSLRQIIFSTNYKRFFRKTELKILVYLSILKNSLIEVINLSEEEMLTKNQRKHKVRLREILKDINVDYNKISFDSSEALTVKKYVENTKGELLVFINHKHNFLNRLLEENIIKESTFYSKIPLLILPEKE